MTEPDAPRPVWRRRPVRWRYLYLAKEYTRHRGHADLLRERVDGRTGE